MTGADEWHLAGGGRVLFIPNADDPAFVDVDHFSRHDDLCARIATDMPREDAEAAAIDWLRRTGKNRLELIEGGRA